MSQAYFKFLQLSRTLKARDCGSLSADHIAVLEVIVLAWHEGSPMAVRDVTRLNELGSPATLHKRLSLLRDAGFIEVKAVDSDHRIKLLAPTTKAVKHFDQLGQAMALQIIGAATPSA